MALFPRRWFAGVVPLLFSLFIVDSVASGQCPSVPTPNVTSSTIPTDVCIPDGFGSLPIDYFDDYSWRSFIAMVWPASNGRRGVPDASKTVGDPGPRVFETYKSLWEIFHRDGTPPSSGSFNDYEAAAQNACNSVPAFGDLVIASFSKFSDLGQADFGTLVGPIAAQNGKYVRYVTHYNQKEFDQIFAKQWFLRSNLPTIPGPIASPPQPFPDGSIDLKSAWMDLSGFSAAQKARYYTKTAMVLNPDTGRCAAVEMGLVGLHIVQKTPTRPQWIWSSFEQIDNVPPAESGSAGLAFNNGNGTPMPPSNPLSLSPLAPQPVTPFNITRSALAPIHPNSAVTNARYRQLLQGTVWKNYQLTLTQWPIGSGSQPVPASQGGDMTHTFPGAQLTSAISNTVLETFDQETPRRGCMNCHNQARLRGDFLWSMLDHAFPPVSGTPDFFRMPEFRNLRRLMLETSVAKVSSPAIGTLKTGAPVSLKSYADVQKLIDAVLTRNNEISGVAGAPHGSFWNSLTYDQFVNGNVPGVADPATGQPIPILVKGNSGASNLILSLQGKGPLFNPDTGTIGQMPANGPPMFTNDEIAAVASWIDAGCPK
jgi:hypothetical protein